MILTPVFAPKNKDIRTIACGIVYNIYTINVEETRACVEERSKNGHLYNVVPLVIGTDEEPAKTILILSIDQWQNLQKEITKFLAKKKNAHTA